jgi:hypothetical protein
MGWSSEEARSLQRPTTVMYANNNNDISEVNEGTGPATAVTVSKEVFLGIDTSKRKQVVTRLTPGEGPKPAEAMRTEALLARIARWVKQGIACTASTITSTAMMRPAAFKTHT